jgi:hypothetical protein
MPGGTPPPGTQEKGLTQAPASLGFRLRSRLFPTRLPGDI